MPRRPPLACLIAGLLTGLLLSGCGRSGSPVTGLSERLVAITPPTGAASLVPGCDDLQADLPQGLPQGLTRRQTTPSSKTTAAWGDPPVALRCGVSPGKETDELFTFNRVQWAMHDTGAARRWTTRGLRTNVEVVVPDHYSSQAEVLGSLSRVLLDDLGR